MKRPAAPSVHARDAPARPWHREFWPWFLIGLVAAVVLACLVTIYLALTHPDPLVPRTDAGTAGLVHHHAES